MGLIALMHIIELLWEDGIAQVLCSTPRLIIRIRSYIDS